LFNTTDKERETGIDFRWLNIPTTVRVRDLWERRDVGPANRRFGVKLPPHGAGLYRLS
jgi:hypothetical protein